MEDNIETLDIDLDDLFKDTDEQPTSDSPVTPSDDADNIEMTKAVSNRINSVKRKTESDTEARIAKELGYDSYAELQKANEKKILKDAGLDDEDISDVVEKLVNKRLAEDPRIKRLEDYEARQKTKFVEEQLNAINNLAGTNFTAIDQLPKDTLKVWEQTGNLKQAYLATQGEALITKSKSAQKNGSLNHLASPGNSASASKTRPLNEEEKAIWRSVMPDISEDELSKKTMAID